MTPGTEVALAAGGGGHYGDTVNAAVEIMSAAPTDLNGIRAPGRGIIADMETVYIDSLFFTNLTIDYLLLLLAGRVCCLPLRRWRILLGAALGGAYAVLTALPGCGWAANMLVKTAAAILMTLAGYGGERRLWRCAGVFFALSAALGGAVYAASLLGGGSTGRGLFAVVPLRVLVLAFALCYAALSVLFRRQAKSAQRQTLRGELRFRGRRAELDILRDTGNFLYDPVTNRPVMVAFAGAVEPLFSKEAAAFLRLDGAEAVTALGDMAEYRGLFRLVPYSAVGTASGLLAAFSPEAVSIAGAEEKGVLVAVSPLPLTGDGGYDAVL